MNKEEKNLNKPIYIYLIIVFAVCYGLGFIEFMTKTGKAYSFLGIIFTFVPVIAGMITKRITKQKSKISLSLKVWKNKKAWLFSAFIPSFMVALGSILYFIVFNKDYSGVFELGNKIKDSSIIINVQNPIFFALICIVISAVMIPIQLLELGEEIGWRGYLLGFQKEKYGEKKAALINGIEWGLSHFPLIYFGFNYSLDNPGAPWSNMLLMLICCLVLGIIFSYIAIKTNNVMYSAIMHGAVNIIGEIPVFLSFSKISGLLGPNPTGLLAMTFLIILALILFFRKKPWSEV